MNDNAQLLFGELKQLDYKPEFFDCPIKECSGKGVKFEYQIIDGSRSDETVVLGLVIPESMGAWPEVTPHWIHICPPDSVLEEQVQANRGNNQGTIRRYKDQEGIEWLAISAPVKDFWDQIEEPNGKNVATYLERHVRRVWGAR